MADLADVLSAAIIDELPAGRQVRRGGYWAWARK
jgi:hypothetical protein